MKKRHAFTLIELLVVIGIIGILATLAVPKIGNALEDAKEQQCRTNLRNLQAAVLAYADDNSGELPRAQSYEVFDSANGTYHNRAAWVTWVPMESSTDRQREKFLETAWESTGSNPKNKTSHTSELADDCGSGPIARFAVERGALFDYVGDLRAYRCPVIEREMRKRVAKFDPDSASDFDEEDKALDDAERQLSIYRTYAMNPYFGAVSVGGGQDRWRPVRASAAGSTHVYRDRKSNGQPRFSEKHYRVPEPSKLLLFTEIIPAYKNNEVYRRKDYNDQARGSGNLSKTACLDPVDNDTKNEYICWDPDLPAGFDPSWEFGIHSSPVKGTHSALAVFYDGHIEKVFSKVPQTGENTVWFLNRGLSPGDPAYLQQ